MHRESAYPLDYGERDYAYIERPNNALLALVDAHVLGRSEHARILDVGCGAGANARAIKQRSRGSYILGVEPNPRAAELAVEACNEVFKGELDAFLDAERAASSSGGRERRFFDAVILSDVIEHIADPMAFLRSLKQAPELAGATFVVSVPNYAVWYNRIRTLRGRFNYSWSGLYDRTHLRFFTRSSIRELLEHAGFEVVDDRCSPSVVQSAAPYLRRMFERDVDEGKHLALGDSRAYRLYERFVEPIEAGVCRMWPELLGFQIISVARVR